MISWRKNYRWQHIIIRGGEQIARVAKVLGAAAWTYVAAAVSAIGSWIFYLFVVLFQEALHPSLSQMTAERNNSFSDLAFWTRLTSV